MTSRIFALFAGAMVSTSIALFNSNTYVISSLLQRNMWSVFWASWHLGHLSIFECLYLNTLAINPSILTLFLTNQIWFKDSCLVWAHAKDTKSALYLSLSTIPKVLFIVSTSISFCWVSVYPLVMVLAIFIIRYLHNSFASVVYHCSLLICRCAQVLSEDNSWFHTAFMHNVPYSTRCDFHLVALHASLVASHNDKDVTIASLFGLLILICAFFVFL